MAVEIVLVSSCPPRPLGVKLSSHYMNLSKLLNEIIKVLTWICWSFSWICQSCLRISFPLPKKIMVRVDQDFEGCWSFCFEKRVLTELKHSSLESVVLGTPCTWLCPIRLALGARLAKLVAQLSFIEIQNSDLLSLAWGLHFLHLKLTLRLSSFITFMTGCGLKPWSKLAHLCWHILSVFKWNSFSSWFDCPAACILDECSLISLDKRDDQPVNSCSGKKTQKMQIQWTDFSSFFNLSFLGSELPFTCEN